jgi:hypothetical protein
LGSQFFKQDDGEYSGCAKGRAFKMPKIGFLGVIEKKSEKKEED